MLGDIIVLDFIVIDTYKPKKSTQKISIDKNIGLQQSGIKSNYLSTKYIIL